MGKIAVRSMKLNHVKPRLHGTACRRPEFLFDFLQPLDGAGVRRFQRICLIKEILRGKTSVPELHPHFSSCRMHCIRELPTLPDVFVRVNAEIHIGVRGGADRCNFRNIQCAAGFGPRHMVGDKILIQLI